MSIDTEDAPASRRLQDNAYACYQTDRRLNANASARDPKAVSVAVVFAATLAVLCAGLAVGLDPRGFADTMERLSPLREAALRVSGGSSMAGKAAIRTNGCGECHQIAGIPRSQRHTAGPALENYADRPLIAGYLQNRPDNLVLWLQDPARYTPDTGKTNLKLDSRTASNIAAYLYRN